MLDGREGIVPEFDYSEGALRIRVKEYEMRIAGGADPEAMVRKGSGKWECFQPEFRLVRPVEQTSAVPSSNVSSQPPARWCLRGPGMRETTNKGNRVSESSLPPTGSSGSSRPDLELRDMQFALH